MCSGRGAWLYEQGCSLDLEGLVRKAAVAASETHRRYAPLPLGRFSTVGRTRGVRAIELNVVPIPAL
jgi:hypothetical protein